MANNPLRLKRNENHVKRLIVIISTCSVLMSLVTFGKGDDCRNIEFMQPLENMALNNHVIRTDRVGNEDLCQLNCYLEPNCVSYNYGPSDDGKFVCELSNRSHQGVSSSDLRTRDGFTYTTIMNACLSSPCSSNGTCQAGFGVNRFRCVCPQGYGGDHCGSALLQCLPSWIAFEGSCYKLFTDLKNRARSKQVCNDNGAHLVTIESADKHSFIYGEFLAGTEPKDYWIGLTDADVENEWKWYDGRKLTGYSNWAAGQPNNHNNDQDCVAIRKGNYYDIDYDGEWHDDACTDKKGFICEK